jgi:beta-phosphoglucomutase
MHYHAFRLTFEEAGREFPMDEYLAFAVGASRDDVIRRVMGEGLPEATFRHLMDEKERHVREYLSERGIDVVPGALDFVRAVRARGVRTAVASASRTPGLILESAGAVELFDAIVGRNEVERTKPFPDLYLRAAEAIGIAPARSLVVEDSPVGVEAALAAGMRVLALTTTEPSEKLAAATAMYASYAEISLEDWFEASTS